MYIYLLHIIDFIFFIKVQILPISENMQARIVEQIYLNQRQMD